MDWYLIVVIFSVGYCSQYDAIVPVNHDSGLAKYEEYHDSKDTTRSQEYKNSESSYEDDLTRINDDYKKYIRGKKNYTGYGDEEYYKKQKKYTNEELDKIFGFTGPTANDEPENIMRPCALDDWACIRKFFASNGNCHPAYGPIPDPFYQDVHTIFFASPNLTATLPGLQIRGLSSAKITEFYYNKKSNNLVFAFELQKFGGVVPRAYLRYRRTAKESIILAGFATIEFGPATFTAVIPKVPKLRLDLADCHVFNQVATPPLFLSPELAASPDPDVVTGFAGLVGRLPLSIQEGILFQAQLLTAVYIQTNICDFGLKLISV